MEMQLVAGICKNITTTSMKFVPSILPDTEMFSENEKLI